MSKKFFLSPEEMLDAACESGIKKSYFSLSKLLLLSFLAGLFIALASVGSNIIAHNISDVGLAKYLAGLIFPAGLIMVVIAGAELYTGNNLVAVSVFSRKVSWKYYFYNLSVVWLGNLAGSVFVAALVNFSGQFDFSEGLLGAYTINVGVYKTNLSYIQSFSSAILCSILVCLAVWMSFAAKDIAGKCLVCFFPIWLFITSGYEHSIANMYYLSSALMAKTSLVYTSLAQSHYGVGAEELSSLTLYGAFIKNLLPVSLGNLVGGTVFVSMWYWLAYYRKKEVK